MDSGPGGSIGDPMSVAGNQPVAHVDQHCRNGELDQEPDQAQRDSNEPAKQKQRRHPAGSQHAKTQEFRHGYTLHEKQRSAIKNSYQRSAVSQKQKANPDVKSVIVTIAGGIVGATCQSLR